jgi:small subunit ribosomal protein S4
MRYTQSKCKLCRREGVKLFLKGERCNGQKCALIKHNYPPGAHGQKGPSRSSEFGKQLREKQKAKRIYGITERPFANYFKKASQKQGPTSENFLRLLEKRLDNAVYRLGFAPSRSQARQLVNHGHFLVNDKRADIPSLEIKIGDIISLNTNKNKKSYVEILKKSLENITPPAWLHLDKSKIEGKILHEPKEEDLDQTLDIKLIIESYSR